MSDLRERSPRMQPGFRTSSFDEIRAKMTLVARVLKGVETSGPAFGAAFVSKARSAGSGTSKRSTKRRFPAGPASVWCRGRRRRRERLTSQNNPRQREMPTVRSRFPQRRTAALTNEIRAFTLGEFEPGNFS